MHLDFYFFFFHFFRSKDLKSLLLSCRILAFARSGDVCSMGAGVRLSGALHPAAPVLHVPGPAPHFVLRSILHVGTSCLLLQHLLRHLPSAHADCLRNSVSKSRKQTSICTEGKGSERAGVTLKITLISNDSWSDAIICQ